MHHVIINWLMCLSLGKDYNIILIQRLNQLCHQLIMICSFLITSHLMYVYIYMHTLYVCIICKLVQYAHIRMYIYINVNRVYACVCMYVFMYASHMMYVCICMYMYVCYNVCMYVLIYKCNKIIVLYTI